MKRWIAALLTLLPLAAVLLWGRRGRPPQPPAVATDSSPEACIERMFDAAGRGDVAAYLDCFTGAERERLC